MRYRFPQRLLGLIGLMALSAAAGAQTAKLSLDARDAPRKVLHATLDIPVSGGPVTLIYPKWIPGEHGPTGPISNLVNVRFTVNGKPVEWRRDDDEMYAFHVDVPSGATNLQATYDFLYTAQTNGFTSAASATSELAIISFNQVVLYPAGAKSDSLQYAASLILPPGWHYGTALPMTGLPGGGLVSDPVSLTTLIDSPVVIGLHERVLPLGTVDGRSHEIDLFADQDSDLTTPDSTVAACSNLIKEAGALFGGRHYRQYHFLLTMSDHVASFGLEHHESSDDRVGAKTMVDDGRRKQLAGLLPHEYVHSWNGKFRRPAGLATGDYHTPMRGELLWVYEGLTDYLGLVLATRCGLQTPEDLRELLASEAALLDNEPGRQWKPLSDTTVEAQILYSTGSEWSSIRRGVDFYIEGDLLWLTVDTIIRQQTQNRRSIDDFCHSFHGGTSNPQVKPYNLPEVMATLNQVAPYDWAGFFKARVYSIAEHPPLDGLQNSGWTLVYNETPNAIAHLQETIGKTADFTLTLGFGVGEDGSVGDVLPNSPAARAGLSPGLKVIGVNGRKYAPDELHAAIAAAKGGTQPIVLLVEDGSYQRMLSVDYHGGERYPHLVRVGTAPDLFSDIVRPRARN
jgi:predicted metalloprotease with PDZ domain